MNNNLKHVVQKFESLSLRERLMVVFATVAVCYVMFDYVLLKPLQAQQSEALASIKKYKVQISDINKQIQAIATTFKEVNSSGINTEIATLKTKINENGQRVETLIHGFVRPHQMAGVLKSLLQQEQGLKLMRLQSQGVQPLFINQLALSPEVQVDEQFGQVNELLQLYRNKIIEERKASLGINSEGGEGVGAAGEKNEQQVVSVLPDIFRHGIEIEFYGDFNSTVSYLQAVEALPWRFYWEEVSYNVEEYPRALVKVVIYTLSLDRGWIGV